MDQFKQISTFAEVATRGSLSAAARAEGVAPGGHRREGLARALDLAERRPDGAEQIDGEQGRAAEAEIGKIYRGKVVTIKEFGAFVEFLPGKDGLWQCFASQMVAIRFAVVGGPACAMSAPDLIPFRKPATSCI